MQNLATFFTSMLFIYSRPSAFLTWMTTKPINMSLLTVFNTAPGFFLKHIQFYSSAQKTVVMLHLRAEARQALCALLPPHLLNLSGLIYSLTYSSHVSFVAGSKTPEMLPTLDFCSWYSHYLRIILTWVSVWLTNSSPTSPCSEPAFSMRFILTTYGM